MHYIRNMQSYIAQIFRVKMPENQILAQLYNEISTTMINNYKHPYTRKYMESLSIDSLLQKSIQLYVGSRSCPRNQTLMKMFMEMAEKKARKLEDQKKIMMVEYYYAYFIKLQAMKNDKKDEFNHSSQLFMQLAEKADPLANYLTAKEIYKLIENQQIPQQDLQKSITDCQNIFDSSICDKQYGGLYYIAEIQETLFQKNQQIKKQDLINMHIIAASVGFPIAFLKLAWFYKEEGQIQLYKRYLKLAAEKGVVEAKHNLGHEYLSGQFFPKDEVKALAWFMNAAAHGFVYSKYNVSKLWASGSSCGRIKPNKKAALVFMEELNRQGGLQVQKQIQQLVKLIEIEKVSQGKSEY